MISARLRRAVRAFDAHVSKGGSARMFFEGSQYSREEALWIMDESLDRFLDRVFAGDGETGRGTDHGREDVDRRLQTSQGTTQDARGNAFGVASTVSRGIDGFADRGAYGACEVPSERETQRDKGQARERRRLGSARKSWDDYGSQDEKDCESLGDCAAV